MSRNLSTLSLVEAALCQVISQIRRSREGNYKLLDIKSYRRTHKVVCRIGVMSRGGTLCESIFGWTLHPDF